MNNYAVYVSDTIENVIVAESKDAAEELSGMNAIVSDPLKGPFRDWVKYNDTWVKEFPPYESWTWNIDEMIWEPPIPYPISSLETGLVYSWDEDSLQWVLAE
jgi:hypothetical protein